MSSSKERKGQEEGKAQMCFNVESIGIFNPTPF